MARLPRLVVPGHPHYVTQRGNPQEPVFFCDDDYRLYLDLLREWAGKAKSQIWAYCLMPNHVHLILTPKTPGGLRALCGAKPGGRWACGAAGRLPWSSAKAHLAGTPDGVTALDPLAARIPD